jgi:rsbT co-antagonist protein RsbR
MSAQELLANYRINAADLERVRKHGVTVVPQMDRFIEKLYDWMRTQPEYEQYFSNPKKLASVQDMQKVYWADFFQGVVDQPYVERRRHVGETHARIGLPLPAYFATMNTSLHLWTRELATQPIDRETYESVAKLCHLDTAIVVDKFSTRTSAIIRDQHEAMLEMSTPVTEVWEDVLMLPIVGMID